MLAKAALGRAGAPAAHDGPDAHLLDGGAEQDVGRGRVAEPLREALQDGQGLAQQRMRDRTRPRGPEIEAALARLPRLPPPRPWRRAAPPRSAPPGGRVGGRRAPGCPGRSARARVRAIMSWTSCRLKKPLPAWVETAMPRSSRARS